MTQAPPDDWKAELGRLGRYTVEGLVRVASILRGPVSHAVGLLLALIVLFEEWGWRPLAALLAQLARLRPIAWIEARIQALPPYAALVVFALPTTILFPLKLLAMWLLAKGQVMAASALFVGAKIASTALIARIFMLTKAALMRIQWFARAYNLFMPWKERLFAEIRASWAWRYGRMLKSRVKLEAKQAWSRVRPQVIAVRERTRAAARTSMERLRSTWKRLTAGD